MNRRLLWIVTLAALLHAGCGPVGITETPDSGGRGAWSTVPVSQQPTARHEAAMLALGGKGYLMGGRGIKPVEELDPQAGTWRRLGPTPLEMHHFHPVAYGDLIYVMTAMTGKYPKETPLETVYIYDPASDGWRQGAAIPPQRRRGGAGTAVYDGKIYLACGIVDGHTSGTVAWFDEFDPATGTWRVLPDAPRAGSRLGGRERRAALFGWWARHELPRARQLHRILRSSDPRS